MRNILIIAKKEFCTFFATPVAYVVICSFLVLSTLYGFMIGHFLASDDASMVLFFEAFRWVYLLLIPAIAMNMWSDEKRSGTFELLMSLPVKLFESILGKYLAGLCTILISLLLTFPLVITIFYLGEVDIGKLLCGYLGAFLLAGMYLAICMIGSILTVHTMISFLLGLLGCMIFNLLGIKALSGLLQGTMLEQISTTFMGCGIQNYYNSILRGVIDLRDLFYFMSVIVICLFIAHGLLNYACGRRSIYKRLSIVLLSVLLIGLCVYKFPLRGDFSSRGTYCISNETRQLLKDEEGLVLRYYYTSNAFKKWPNMTNYSSRIEDLLREYERVVKVERIDVATMDISEDAAKLDGVEPNYVEGVGRVWHGLVAVRGKERVAILQLPLELEPYLEFEITTALRALLKVKKTKIGLISSIPVGGDSTANASFGPWHAINMLGYQSQLTILPRKIDKIDPNFKILIIIHGVDLSPNTLRAIDAYLNQGGRLLLLVDPNCFYAAMAPQKLKVDWVTGEKLSSSLGIFSHILDVDMNDHVVATDMTLAWNELTECDPATILFSNTYNCLNSTHVITQNLKHILMRYAGILIPKMNSHLKHDILLQTTPDAMVESKYLAIKPHEILARFKSDSIRKTVALSVEGLFNRFYNESKCLKPGKAVVISDVDFLFDTFATKPVLDPVDGKKVLTVLRNDNEAFFFNIIDYLNDDTSLIALRGGRDLRAPFNYFTEKQSQLKQKVISNEMQLVDEYHMVENDLTQLREKNASQKEIQACEMRRDKVIESLRNIDQFNHQIQSIQTRILLWNLLAIPALLMAIGSLILITLYIRRRAR